GLILLNPDTDQVPADIVALREPMQRLAGDDLIVLKSSKNERVPDVTRASHGSGQGAYEGHRRLVDRFAAHPPGNRRPLEQSSLIRIARRSNLSHPGAFCRSSWSHQRSYTK